MHKRVVRVTFKSIYINSFYDNQFAHGILATLETSNRETL